MVKQFILRRQLLLVLLLVLIFNNIACRTEKKNDLFGTWLVVNAFADFDERRVNPQTFHQAIAYLKETRLVFDSDSTLTIERGASISKSRWRFGAAANEVVLEDGEIGLKKLSLHDGRLHTSELTPLGEIRLVFEKQKH
ncbi:MAG TPA: hypothetical protein PKE03_03120 [Bacteroidales bacterium]|mgnify:CR=1 FL=1|nr:hypothetical protein [Bacteroidales bacterium]